MCIITSGLTIAGITISAAVANSIIATGAIAAVASTTLGAAASIKQNKATEAQYNYQAQIEKENQKVALGNAKAERQQGIEEERLQRIKSAQAVGSQTTAMAANGIDVTQGTAVDVLEDTAIIGELDALQTRYNYERKALAYETQGNNFANQANLDSFAAKNAYSAGKWNTLAAGVQGISSATSVASKWYDGYGSSSSGFSGIKWKKADSGYKLSSKGSNIYAGYLSGLA